MKSEIKKISDNIISELKQRANPTNREGMARYGINTSTALGVNIPFLRELAKKHKKSENRHELAQSLWKTNIHEARMLAAFIDDPSQVTEQQMESWVHDFNSWDLCDQTCSNLFDKTPFAWKKVVEWTKREKEFVKRAGFVLMACLAVHDKKANDKEFLKFPPIIKRESTDERNMVRKAVNWALRQIGKRSLMLNKASIKTGQEIRKLDSKAARWIASDALRELQSNAVFERLKSKQ